MVGEGAEERRERGTGEGKALVEFLHRSSSLPLSSFCTKANKYHCDIEIFIPSHECIVFIVSLSKTLIRRI